MEMYVIYVTIVVVVHMVVAAEIVFARKVIPVELGTSETIPCDHVQNNSKVRLVQWYKSRNIDEFLKDDGALAWWQDGVNGSISNYRLESRSFSLVIINSSLEGEGLYKCSVTHGDLYEESNYFIRTVTYALPRKEPTVDFVGNHVRCSLEHVKPPLYPVLNFPSDEAYAVLNEDGTYTTSVGCTLPTDNADARVECSFSIASLIPHHITSDEPTEKTTMSMSTMATSTVATSTMATSTVAISTMATSTIPPDNGSGNGVLMPIIICSVIFCAFLIVIITVCTRYRVKLHRKTYRDVQESNKVKESEIMI